MNQHTEKKNNNGETRLFQGSEYLNMYSKLINPTPDDLTLNRVKLR